MPLATMASCSVEVPVRFPAVCLEFPVSKMDQDGEHFVVLLPMEIGINVNAFRIDQN